MITQKEIRETNIYKALNPETDFIKLKFINCLSVQKIIIHGYIVAINTGAIPGNITGINRLIIEELIKTKKNERQSK
jgi:hypothetical protein